MSRIVMRTGELSQVMKVALAPMRSTGRDPISQRAVVSLASLVSQWSISSSLAIQLESGVVSI